MHETQEDSRTNEDESARLAAWRRRLEGLEFRIAAERLRSKYPLQTSGRISRLLREAAAELTAGDGSPRDPADVIPLDSSS